MVVILDTEEANSRCNTDIISSRMGHVYHMVSELGQKYESHYQLSLSAFVETKLDNVSIAYILLVGSWTHQKRVMNSITSSQLIIINMKYKDGYFC